MYQPCRPLLIAGAALALVPHGARAEPGASDTFDGTAQAEVVNPGRMLLVRDLRFGAFIQPATAATLTIAASAAGTVTGTGDVAAGMAIPQPADGRGPALILLDGTARRSFTAIIPNRIDITNGAATMQVRNITSNVSPGNNSFDADGHFDLYIGGRLNIGALQAVGNYSGDFQITVIFH